MRHFVGGQRALMPETLAMVASNVNSYRRLIPGFWAPTDATWGVENRTTALRVIPGSAKSTRVEYRVAAADANPYLALAAAVGAGAVVGADAGLAAVGAAAGALSAPHAARTPAPTIAKPMPSRPRRLRFDAMGLPVAPDMDPVVRSCSIKLIDPLLAARDAQKPAMRLPPA